MADQIPFLDFVRVKHFGCIRDARLELTPLHALVGPNDAGKSTFLHAIGVAARALHGIYLLPPPDPAHDAGRALALGIGATVGWWTAHRPSQIFLGDREGSNLRGWPERIPHFQGRLRRVTRLRLNAEDLRKPSPLIPSQEPTWFSSATGLGLPGLLDAIAGRNLDGWVALREEFHARFPTVRSLDLRNADSSMKSVGLVLKSGESVGAEAMSEGQLYWLAFAALRHQPDPPSVVLLEEPETGLHPSRIREVMKVLREVAERGTQIVLATHSPLVVNELRGDEITVVTRSLGEGTMTTLLKDTPNYAARSKVYAHGELWVSYADGVEEAALLTGGSRP